MPGRSCSRERLKAFAILDCTLWRIDCVVMAAGRGLPYYSGWTGRMPPATLRRSLAPALDPNAAMSAAAVARSVNCRVDRYLDLRNGAPAMFLPVEAHVVQARPDLAAARSANLLQRRICPG